VETRVEGRKLIIEINLDEQEGTTSNGNISVASTRGWLTIEKGVTLSLNLVKKVSRK
jgi:hypothetical protein